MNDTPETSVINNVEHNFKRARRPTTKKKKKKLYSADKDNDLLVH